ncbi:MAG: discoidin domain-containing protein, partial [Gemmatimonadota bacterium]
SDYYRLLETYTRDQRRDGRPYVAEAANPFTGSWEGHNTFYHSEHYFHSGYVDLIITGLAGLRPRADDSVEVNPLVPDDWDYFALDGVSYHGHDLSIVWDRDGTRYGRGSGLSVLVNGRAIANAPSVRRIVAPIAPPVTPDHIDRPINFAVNNGGSAFPWVTASASDPTAPPHYAVDGNYWYHESPPNRWTAAGSGNAADWLAIDFGTPRPVTEVKAYFYDDGEGVRAPASYEVEQWDGSAWQPIPGQTRTPADPAGHRANVITFPVLSTEKIRLVMTHQAGASSGLSELETWGHTGLPLEPGTRPSPNVAFGDNVRTTASYTWQSDSVEHLNDMQIAFTRYSRNRWTAYRSPNARDWIELDWGAGQTVAVVDLYLYADGGGIAPPTSFAIELWDGNRWIAPRERGRYPESPTGSALNRIRLVPTAAERLRVTFEHAPGAFTGVTEIMILEREP